MSLDGIPLPELASLLRNETGSTNVEPVQTNEKQHFICGMPLILCMGLDALVKEGKITAEEAAEIVRKANS